MFQFLFVLVSGIPVLIRARREEGCKHAYSDWDEFDSASNGWFTVSRGYDGMPCSHTQSSDLKARFEACAYGYYRVFDKQLAQLVDRQIVEAAASLYADDDVCSLVEETALAIQKGG